MILHWGNEGEGGSEHSVNGQFFPAEIQVTTKEHPDQNLSCKPHPEFWTTALRCVGLNWTFWAIPTVFRIVKFDNYQYYF